MLEGEKEGIYGDICVEQLTAKIDCFMVTNRVSFEKKKQQEFDHKTKIFSIWNCLFLFWTAKRQQIVYPLYDNGYCYLKKC